MVNAILSVILAALSLHVATLTIDKDPDFLEAVKITSSDGSAEAHFIKFGATTTNFFVKDKNGKFRDILLGFDDHTLYPSQADGHPYFGPVVGRYANRIRNGTFTIPISYDASGPGEKFHIAENENNGEDTLHGGFVGYDQRNWSIVTNSSSSVTFRLVDPNGDQGFPGTVVTDITYTLLPKSTWKITMHAVADELTPIMLSCHHYWNLDAYEVVDDLVGHYAQFDASRVIATDGILIPTGELFEVAGTPLDFREAKSIGASINATAEFEYCGTGCVGFDNCWIYDDNNGETPAFQMWSVNSGIKLEVTTDQRALQVYTCNGIFNASLPIPRKVDQGGPDAVYDDHTCVVIEQESWIDAINHPNFGIDQIYGGSKEYNWESTYVFSVLE